MIHVDSFDEFTVYRSAVSNCFLYAHFEDTDLFMEGLADYLLSETNLLNYANVLTPIEFSPTPEMYKKLYSALDIFLNDELDELSFDDVSGEVYDALGQEYRFIDSNGQTLIQNDKIGKLGEYIFHLILTKYYRLHCIIPKFRCTTSRNMSVFGIDALFFDPAERKIFFGESKVCNTLDNAITLINHSLSKYEVAISEEYKLVLSNDGIFNLSPVFSDAFKNCTDKCISFFDFIKAAEVHHIGIPAFLAHGFNTSHDSIEQVLNKMNTKLKRKDFFGLTTEYIFISMPIIDKNKMLNSIMKKVVKKSNEYRNACC